ncbi:hypothetical protein ATANTOWER_029234 [Ataeniobius toweri]|uniref:CCHC-type domain-containing protein n=1 Tax=Ataeniobius toweri TaxID=208326 RepID=A0ABU7ARK8_9TELE|nr:hypothetical protein [Ataeniobius toweri]
MPSGSWQNWAMHAEKVVSGKKKQPPTDTFYAEDDIFYAGLVSRGRGRMRGIFRGREGDNDTCWSCGQHGHWAKNCPTGQGEVDENKEMIDIAAAYMDKLRSSPSATIYVSLHEILITSPTGII